MDLFVFTSSYNIGNTGYTRYFLANFLSKKMVCYNKNWLIKI